MPNLLILFAVTAIRMPDVTPASGSRYSYEYHNILLDQFDTEKTDIEFPCNALKSDEKRSGRISFKLACVRRPLQLKISAPDQSTCSNALDPMETFRLYLNVRSIYLPDMGVLTISDPVSSVRKQLTTRSSPQLIDFGLQSYLQLLTTGKTAVMEYSPGLSTQRCDGKDGNSVFLDLEYVLISNKHPDLIEVFKLTKCAALQGYIPTGILCDQYSSTRPLGCPVNITDGTTEPDVAMGQDRRGLDCYRLTLGTEADDILRAMTGSMVILGTSGARSLVSSYAAALSATSVVFYLFFT